MHTSSMQACSLCRPTHRDRGSHKLPSSFPKEPHPCIMEYMTIISRFRMSPPPLLVPTMGSVTPATTVAAFSLYMEQTLCKNLHVIPKPQFVLNPTNPSPTEVPSGMTMAKNRRALADAPGTVKVLGMELGTPTAVLPPGVMFASCWLPAGLHTHGLLSFNCSTG